jgi:hypothetical protein
MPEVRVISVGGYQRGASAQDEDLCRRSCLADLVDTHLDETLSQIVSNAQLLCDGASGASVSR